MIYIRYCKKCHQAYDIGINYDLCPECRMKKMKEGENGEKNK